MHKLYNLYKNEMIKIVSNVSVVILFIVMIFATGATAGLMKITYNLSKNDEETIDQNKDIEIENVKNELNYNKSDYEAIKNKIQTVSEDEKYILQLQEIRIKNYIEVLEKLIEKKIPNDGNWIANCLYEISSTKTEIEQMKLYGIENLTTEEKNKVSLLQSNMDKLLMAYNENDYNKYLDIQDSIILANNEYSDKEKEIYLDSNKFRKKLNPNGNGYNDSVGVDEHITYLQEARISLANNVDSSSGSNKPLTNKAREELENKIAVGMYKINNDISMSNSLSDQIMKNSVPSMINFATLFLAIMIIIIAGSTISSEISTGSIKSLIIAPVKRSKIYTAKILAIITWMFVSLITIFVAVTIFNAIVFGVNSVTPFISARNGSVYQINFYIHLLLSIFIKGISVFVFAVFAIMLSTITRNSAISIGLSIACLLGESVIVAILGFVKGEWLKFVPYANIDLQSRIFPTYDLFQGYGNLIMESTKPSLVFSICYLIVALICMLYIGYDSFIRKDLR